MNKHNNIDLKEVKKQYIIETWRPEDVGNIYEQLEKPNWAPWLSFSEQGMREMIEVFPEGQLVVKDKEGVLLAYMSTNRVDWDGRIESLPTWDDVAGDQVEEASYDKTYKKNGNTLVIMCLSVDEKHQGKYLPAILMDEGKELAKRLDITHFISPFRPSTYGEYKTEHEDPGFHAYINMKRDDGLPIDAWIRNVVRNGVEILHARDNSIVVTVSREEFEKHRTTHKPDAWKEVAPGVWECGEVGQWFIENDKAVYRETELWGRVPLK